MRHLCIKNIFQTNNFLERLTERSMIKQQNSGKATLFLKSISKYFKVTESKKIKEKRNTNLVWPFLLFSLFQTDHIGYFSNVLILSALKRHKLSKWPSAELKMAPVSVLSYFLKQFMHRSTQKLILRFFFVISC